MKAWTLRAPASADSRPLELTDISRPVPAADEILVRVSACGICRTDLHVVEGELSVRRSRVIPGHQVVGRVAAMGNRVQGFEVGQRVGIAWLNRTCGTCQFCASDRENLCDDPQFTGWTVNGGFAEYTVAPAAFAYSLPEGFDDLQFESSSGGALPRNTCREGKPAVAFSRDPRH
jgi:propanol-preferring alcohol dehydrogenase